MRINVIDAHGATLRPEPPNMCPGCDRWGWIGRGETCPTCKGTGTVVPRPRLRMRAALLDLLILALWVGALELVLTVYARWGA